MFVESFRIDGFGIFSDVQVNELSPGLSIFLGENEAGKSTCLEFLRTILTGYGTGQQGIPPLRGGQAGGALVLNSREHGVLHLQRRPGRGNTTLAHADGSMASTTLLDSMLAGVTADEYRAIFGFGLDELQALGKLDAEGLRRALFSATFGAGLATPGSVQRTVERRLNEIFRESGSGGTLNMALERLAILREDLHKTSGEYADYDRLATELEQLKEQLAAIKLNRKELDFQCRTLGKRLAAWDQWLAWREDGLKLERLPAVNAHFPRGGDRRMESLLADRTRLEQEVASREATHQRLQVRLEAMMVNGPLLEALPRLRQLVELKGSYRQALAQTPRHEEHMARLNSDLQAQLSRLGAGWDCERIRQTDRSIFNREDMDRQAAEMLTAASTHKATLDALNRANREVAMAEENVAHTREELLAMPCPTAELDDDGRDALRQQLLRCEDGLRQLPEDEQEFAAAKTAFKRIWDPLRLTPGKSESDARQELDRLLEHQEEALALATKVQSCIDEANEANQTLAQAQETADKVKSRIDSLMQSQQAGSPSREALVTKADALRQLRSLAPTLKGDKERLEDLKSRLANEKGPRGTTCLPLIVIGAVLCLCGVGALLAHALWGVTALMLTSSLEMPVNLWSGYLVLVCGVAFLGGGLPRTGPEAKRFKQDMEILRGRVEASALQVQEKEDKATQLCHEIGIANWDEDSLAACEENLEQQREHCFREERILSEMTELRREQTEARTRLGEAQAIAHEKESLVQQTRRRWHEFMTGLKVPNVPLPDAAHKFFAHVESARLAVESVVQASEKMARHQEDLQSLCQELADMPAVASRLPEDSDLTPQMVMDGVHAVLEACKEADIARENRLQKEAQLHAREDDLARAQNRQGEIAEELRQHEERRRETDEAWRARLQTLGLGLDLTPDTVREAFRCMDDCLALEAEAASTAAALLQCNNERDALVVPLTHILETLATSAALDSEGQPDWLATLDCQLTNAEDMAKTDGERQQLMKQMEDARDALETSRNTLDAVLAQEKELLALAGVPDSESFLRMAATDAETKALQHHRQEIEDHLRVLADGDLDAFLASFADLDRAEEEARLGAIEEELRDTEHQIEVLRRREGELAARVETLEKGETLSAQWQTVCNGEARIRSLADQWAQEALLYAILDETRREFERDRQPAIIQEASAIFRQITGGRWEAMRTSLDKDEELRFLPTGQDETLGPDALSRGTREQAYLALRLAYVSSRAQHAESLPIVMDDVLVNFDAARASQTAAALSRLAGTGKGQQIFYFTCHPAMVDIVRQGQPDVPLYTMANGTITKAH